MAGMGNERFRGGNKRVHGELRSVFNCSRFESHLEVTLTSQIIGQVVKVDNWEQW